MEHVWATASERLMPSPYEKQYTWLPGNFCFLIKVFTKKMLLLKDAKDSSTQRLLTKNIKNKIIYKTLTYKQLLISHKYVFKITIV